MADVPFCPDCGKPGSALTQAQPRSPQPAQAAVPRSRSHTGRNVGIVFILLILFVVAPVVPYTFASYSFGLAGVQATGDVSLSFAIFHCGMVINVQASGSYGGFSGSYNAGNPGWVCNGSG